MSTDDDRPAPPLPTPWLDRTRNSETSISDGLFEALDWLEQGIVLVSGDGRVMFASAAAREILSGERGLMISNGLLQARSSAEAATLRHLIARCASAAAGGEPSPLLSCRAGQPPLFLLVARAARSLSAERRGDLAIVFIVDPSRVALPSVGHLRHHFGLTAAEGVVAIDVISGEGLGACARRLGISLETARTHMRHIFEKTGVKRQAELVRLLLSARHSVRQPGPSAPSESWRVIEGRRDIGLERPEHEALPVR